MANITVTVADVRPLGGAVIRRACATEALAFGDIVYIDSATGAIPNVSKAVGTDLATGHAYGIVVSGNLAGTSVAIGEACDVVVLGPVTGYSSMTPGATVWVSDTAGRLSDSVGTCSCILGVAESAATVLVRPIEAVRST